MGDVRRQFEVNEIDHAPSEQQQQWGEVSDSLKWMELITHRLRDDEWTMGDVSRQFKVNEIHHTQAGEWMGEVSGQFQVNEIDHALAEGQQVNNGIEVSNSSMWMGFITHKLRDDDATMGEVSGQFKMNEIHHTPAEGWWANNGIAQQTVQSW